MYPDSLRTLIESFKYLPGIGEKTAERLSFSILEMSDEKIELFAKSVSDVKKKIHKCPVCNTLTEGDLCEICIDQNRNKKLLCVVEDVKNVFLLEKLGTYSGMYHVLSGLISPLDGINPEDIGIDQLIKRIKEEKFEEIILAFKPSIEGETTALYISKIFEDTPVIVSKIAHGVPLGTDMEYIDSLTLEMALEDRKNI